MEIAYIVLFCAALTVAVFALWRSGRISMKTKAYSVDQAKYLGNRSNPPNIYDKPGQGSFYSPFNISLEEMNRLLLVDIADDPEYSTIELQVFDDEKGLGAAVILYRKNGEIDTYYTAGLNRDVYQGSSGRQALLNNTIEYGFEITKTGLDSYLSLEDRLGQRIEFAIRENQPAKKTFDILAPAGAMIENLAGFPFFYMKRTAFVEYAGTQINIEIGGTKRKPVAIPIAINGIFVYLARYCTEPIVGTWNQSFTGILDPLLPQQAGISELNGTRYSIVDNDRHYEIDKIIGMGFGHEISLAFSPPIPDLACLKDGVTIRGRFSSGADGTTGIVAGDYWLEHDGTEINFVMQPTKGWQPMPGKSWVKSYRWHSNIDVSKQGKVMAKSEWSRS